MSNSATPAYWIVGIVAGYAVLRLFLEGVGLGSHLFSRKVQTDPAMTRRAARIWTIALCANLLLVGGCVLSLMVVLAGQPCIDAEPCFDDSNTGLLGVAIIAVTLWGHVWLHQYARKK
ncbi:MAG: hypothetical protein WDZ37_07230 [Solirubrobacterales bacterium]